MKVIFLEDVPNVAKAGEAKDVGGAPLPAGRKPDNNFWGPQEIQP